MTDQQFTETDLDGDGTIDAVAVDADGDGYAEALLTNDAEGRFEVLTDTDASGFYDTESIDDDGDGVLDTTSVDLNEDGVVDERTTDLDGDGTADLVEVDVTGDGRADVISVAGETLVLDSDGRVVEVVFGDGDDAAIPDEESVPDATERASDATYWFEQSENGFCMPASVAQIVVEYSDQGVTEDAFVQRAVEMGYLTYDEGTGWSGMTAQQGAELLESFGVDCTLTTGDVDSLDQYLGQGYNAIVTIDSSVVWEGDEAGVADHAVVVSSIENGMVYLNDPGIATGQLEPVTVEAFEEAWSSSGGTMIITDEPDLDRAVGAEAAGELAGNQSTARGSILLPVVLTPEAWADVSTAPSAAT